jgi:hypothetical protein
LASTDLRALPFLILPRSSPIVMIGYVPDTARRPGSLNLAAYTGTMSVQREELLRLVEELPEEEVPAVLDDVRRHLRSLRERPWPPAWFGAGEGSADDVAARSEDLLRDGFGHSA